ncbi:acetyl-CoA carboxylase biotin carboxyl carrier protein subunit [Paludibacteraceae bacterium OttesenSCG-928-F17]|nr:acetyl-CoA carboxylase biotin carboxyl carrier protein subunit [Paludibacteraceae bacterium OttesenSCG-928-F17]
MKKFSFDINGEKYEVDIKSVEGNLVDIEVNGTPYSVKMDKEVQSTPAPVARPSASAAKPAEKVTPVASTGGKSGSKSVKSPLPGNVLKINVAVGDSFKDGDVLMVMESMKMENNILAESDGTITKVNAPVGKAVLQDEVLFEYE